MNAWPSCWSAAIWHRPRTPWGSKAKAIAEAFPSTLLGVMLPDPAAVPARRSDRSDLFFRHCAEAGILDALLAYLLPGRALSPSWGQVTDHDDRAALVCALTALAFAAGDFTAVGDGDGWILLPPRRFVRDWAWADLEANASSETTGCLLQLQPPSIPEPGTGMLAAS
jgi:hypothetical protein